VRGEVEKASSPITSDMSSEEVREELQHRRKVAASVREDVRDEAEEERDAEASSPAATSSRDGSRRWEPTSSGAGFLLGLGVWVVARNFIEGGMPQVRRLLKAKFLNQVEG
jgi:hypothetical protein